jgi:hypothetical protein
MQLTDDLFSCEWCGAEFFRRCHLGRRPLYCRRTCRQRAYESRRRGAWFLGLPKPTVADPRSPGRPEYQAGRGGTIHLPLVHALRPDGGADGTGARPSLCGALVQPLLYNFFPPRAPSGSHNCITCAAVATHFPPTHRVRPLSDVGTVTALIAPLRTARLASEDCLRREVDTLLTYFGAPGGSAFQPRRLAQMTSQRYGMSKGSAKSATTADARARIGARSAGDSVAI